MKFLRADVKNAIAIVDSILSLEPDKKGELYADEKWLFKFLIRLEERFDEYESFGYLSRDDIRCSIWRGDEETAKKLEITDHEFRRIVDIFGESVWALDLWDLLGDIAKEVLEDKVKEIDPTIR